MFIDLKKELRVQDGSKKVGTVDIPTGKHEIERIENPHGRPGKWLVLKGTPHGMVEQAWRNLASLDKKDPARVEIEE